MLSINELEAFECLFDYQKKQLTLYGLKPDGKPFESLKIPAARLSVPFELVAQRPLIKIKIGKSNLKVVLDNTVQTNLLSSGLLKKFSKLLHEAKNEASKSAEGSSLTATRAKIDICKLGKLDYREMEYLFTDTAHLGKTGKLKPDGVLGQDSWFRALQPEFQEQKLLGLLSLTWSRCQSCVFGSLGSLLCF